MSSGYPPYGGTQNLLCQRCQAPLFPNESTCRNCGYSNVAPVQGPSSNSSWSAFTVQPPQSQPAPPSWGQFAGQPAPSPSMQPPQGQIFPTPSSSSPQMGSGNFFGAPSQPSSPPTQGNGYASNQAPSSYITPPAFTPQQPYGGGVTGPGGPQFAGGQFNGPISQMPLAPYGTPAPGFQPYGTQSPGQMYPGTGPFDPSRGSSANMPPFSMGTAAPSSSANLPPFPMTEAARTSSANLPPFPMGNAAPSSAAFPGTAQPVFNDAAKARQPKPWLIVLIVVLIIFVAGGGIAGYTYLNRHTTAGTTPTSTTTTTNTPKSTPLFSDTFKNNANKWSLQSDPGKFSISMAGNALLLEDDSNELLWEPLPGNKTFSDFTLSFDAMLSHGDQVNGYGVYVRGSSVQNTEMATYYRFELYGDGSYAIFKGTVDANGTPANSKLVDYTLDAAIQKMGTINHISITAKGSTLSLTVNGQLIKTITDSSYANGAIAPFVSNMQNAKPGAQAKFENLQLYSA